MPRTACPPTIHTHHWEGFRYESRLTRSASPGLDPVVLIGGAMQRKEDWGRLEHGMLESADVVTLDLPGWGEADPLPSRYGSELLAGALRHALDDLRIARANVFAGSYGTAIAYRLAQTRPERIARMVLLGTMASIPDHSRPTMRAVLDLVAADERERLARTAIETLMAQNRDADIASRALVERILRLRISRIGGAEIAHFVANTRRLLDRRLIDTCIEPEVPALFATGEHDPLTPPALCREMALTCPDSWFATIGRADHLSHLERPAEVVDLMTRFFGERPLTDLPYANRIEDLRRTPVLG